MAVPPAPVVEELYAAPLRSFIRERDARASALSKAGQPEQARAVKQLRRPAASLWAVNQLAHADPKRLAALIDAVGRARAAQLRDPRGAAEAFRTQRADLQTLVSRAGEVLGAQGYRLTPAISRRISDTLLGAAVDRWLVADLRRGRLMADVPAPGFEVLSGAARPLRLVQGAAVGVEPRHPPAAKTPDETGTGTAKRESAQAARRARAAATEAAHRARAIAADEERARRRRDAEALEREAAARAAAVQQAQREVAEAAAALTEMRQRLLDAKGAARAAWAAARRARRAAK
jgi:hypothetical protein